MFLIATCYNEVGYFKIDRMNNKVINFKDVHEMSRNCTDLKPLPGFDFYKFPFLISRTLTSINLVDVRNEKSYILLLDAKPSFDNEFLSFVKKHNKLSIVFASTVKGENCDLVKKFKIPNKLIKGLYHFARHDV